MGHEVNEVNNIVRIKGSKVNLCLIRKDDEAIKLYTKWMADESINKYLGSQRISINTLDGEKCWANRELSPYEFAFNIVDKGTDRLIGNCDINIERHRRNATLGICIGEHDFHGKGYGTEVIKMLVRFAFEQLGMHNVRLQLNSDNARAYKCYTKAGFVECCREKEESWIDNHWTDCITMQILESDYQNLKDQGVY